MLDYFSYLRITNKQDTQDNFITYLVEIVDYTEEDATRYAKIFY